MSTPRAAVYIRKSTIPGDENRSLDLQKQTCLRIADQNGYQVVETYSQVVSGYDPNAKNTEFKRLLEDIRQDRIDIVISLRTDRFGRRLASTAQFLDTCREHNVKIHSESGVLDPKSPTDSFTFNLFASLAQQEAAMISARVTADFADRAYKGWTGGNIPFGFKKTERNEEGYIHLIPHETEGPVVRELADCILKKHMSVIDACAVLNKKGHRTRTGKLWTYKHATRTLLNPTNAGFAVHNFGGPRHREQTSVEPLLKDGKRVKIHTPILDEDEWDLIRDLLKVKNPVKRATRRSPFLSGLVYCDECGSRMVAGYSSNRGKVYRRYICPGFANPEPDRCNNGISDRQLETFILDFVRSSLKNNHFMKALDARVDKAQDDRPFTEMFEKLDELQDLELAYTQQLQENLNPRTVSTITRQLDKVAVEIENVTNKITRLRRQQIASYSIHDIYAAISSMDKYDQRYAVENVVERINIETGKRVYTDGTQGSATIDLARVKIRRKFSKGWIQLKESTPAPLPRDIECLGCKRFVPRERFTESHGKNCVEGESV